MKKTFKPDDIVKYADLDGDRMTNLGVVIEQKYSKKHKVHFITMWGVSQPGFRVAAIERARLATPREARRVRQRKE